VAEEDTLLKKETGKIVRTLALVGLILCLVVIVAYGITRFDPQLPSESWLHGFLSGITLAMAMLPEEFPVVLTIFMALGAWRMSKRHVLTRKVAVVETLGSATVLCTDKTGTLTQNRMTVQQLCRARILRHRLQGEHRPPAPEAIFDLCHFSYVQKENLGGVIRKMASRGLRMITGDYPETAINIARQIGLKNSEKYLSGSDIESFSEDELRACIRDVNIFARVVPEHKLKIVSAFKANGEIVAMTGDGVNDAPSR
jgi:magnesium-transporting ATPase (P-type)